MADVQPNGINSENGGSRSVPAPGVVWALGDSILANGYTAPTGAHGDRFTALSIIQWACLYSMGKLIFGGVASTAGFTSAQALATHLPTVAAAKPQFCLVHVGTNDNAAGLTFAQTTANLTAIYQGLIAAGVTPIATSFLPKHSNIGSGAGIYQALTTWVQRYALQSKGSIVYVDWTTDITDQTNADWLNYATNVYEQVDGIHPNQEGARTLGKKVSDTLSASLVGVVALPNATPNGYALSPTLTNGLMLLDTNADGIPDTWSVLGAQAGNAPPVGTTNTLTAMLAAEGLGNWFNLHRPTGGIDAYTVSNLVTLTPGNKVLFACKIKTANVVTNAASFDLRIATSTLDSIAFALDGWVKDITLGLFYGVFTVPSGAASPQWQIRLQLHTAICDVSLGQPMFYDLTAQAMV